MKPSHINIYTEANPNPNSLKFVFNFNLTEDPYDFRTKESAIHSPLAEYLFKDFEWVDGVFISTNFITITKNDKVEDWYEVQSEMRGVLKAYFEEGRKLLYPSATPANAQQPEQEAGSTEVVEDSETVKKIKVVLEEYVRPAVENDGGAISFHSFNDGIVKVILQGACSGCPSSTVTLKSGIENLLQRMVPEVKEVVAEGV